MIDPELRTELNSIRKEQRLMREDIIRICTRCNIFHANGQNALVKAIMLHWPKVLAGIAFAGLWIKSNGHVQADQIKQLQDAVKLMLTNW